MIIFGIYKFKKLIYFKNLSLQFRFFVLHGFILYFEVVTNKGLPNNNQAL